MRMKSFIRGNVRETEAGLFISFAPPRSLGRVESIGFVGGVGWFRKHGRSNGVQKYEVCLDNNNPSTPILKEFAERGDIVYAEVFLPNGDVIPIDNKPYIDRGLLCMYLPMKLNDIWEEVWREGKPVLVMFAVRR